MFPLALKQQFPRRSPRPLILTLLSVTNEDNFSPLAPQQPPLQLQTALLPPYTHLFSSLSLPGSHRPNSQNLFIIFVAPLPISAAVASQYASNCSNSWRAGKHQASSFALLILGPEQICSADGDTAAGPMGGGGQAVQMEQAALLVQQIPCARLRTRGRQMNEPVLCSAGGPGNALWAALAGTKPARNDRDATPATPRLFPRWNSRSLSINVCLQTEPYERGNCRPQHPAPDVPLWFTATPTTDSIPLVANWTQEFPLLNNRVPSTLKHRGQSSSRD